MPSVTLLNANEMRPPVGPIALDYLAQALEETGCEVRLLDLTWEAEAGAALAAHFRDWQPTLVALTQRNSDDCYLAGRYSCVPHARRVADLVRRYTDAPLVVGGCGYSIFPAAMLQALAADYGVRGEGEEALPRLAQAVERGEDPRRLPGLVYGADGEVQANAPEAVDLAALPAARRAWVDNARYWREGGQGGFETKRGCPGACVFCADPVAKGRRLRLRRPEAVVQEIAHLVAQGVAHLHTCDAEFNLPRAHALAVCAALLEAGLADRARWWAYCAPESFDRELAGQMRRAGCVGIDFGADHGSDEQLARLGRRHRVEDLVRTAEACRAEGLVFMYDLLLGAPGETREGVAETIALMKRLEPSRVGLSLGVRLYPGTPLTERLRCRAGACSPSGRGTSSRPTGEGLLGALEDNESLLQPIFYLDPAVPDLAEYVHCLAGSDPRFLCPDPAAEMTDYNYRENPALVAAIAQGYRGAYWDILRRVEEGIPSA
jgi:hypothetical protein